MKHTYKYFLCAFILAATITACKKTADVPATNPTTNDSVTIIGGATSAYLDTVVAVVNTVTIKYSRTNQCYPSNEIFAFSASGVSLPSGTTYNWDFGDGHTLTGANSTATVGNIYQTAGDYTVTLTINDANKNKLSATTLNLHAHGQQVSPHASFYAQIFDINYPNNYNFNANGSSVTRGHLSNFNWVWGDGTNTSAATPDNTPHGFPQIPVDTTYPVKLVVTSSEGCMDTAVVPVTIGAVYSNITGDFDTVQNNACTAEYFTFKSNATNVPANAVYTWDFGDATGTPSGNPINHTFTYQNTYDVKLYISVNGKIIYTTHKPIWANGQNVHPTALFFKNISGNETTTYVKWAMYSSANIQHGYIEDYSWYMDNTLLDNNTNATYEAYPFNKTTTASTHTITFIVTSNVGCKDTATATITIPPIGQYTY